ncbi:MAG: hypothetical protein RMJ56_11420 [Gemmataceae bacterium]|nr:hypothetical protein [Gemmata sp.]MDW8198200.1 hypothetical protein [Gemmataceae bacterium]
MALRWAIAIGGSLMAVVVVAAQPKGKNPPLVQFPSFGTTPEQFQQSAWSRWSGQLLLDLENVKTDIGTARLTLPVRTAINAHIENAIRQTLELDQLIRRGGNRSQLLAALAEVERALTQLAATINQNAAARAAAAAALGRADTAYQQLAVALGTGDNDPVRSQRRLIRLGDTLDDTAEELRNLVGELVGGNDRTLERTLGGYAREARLLSRRVRDNEETTLIQRTYAAMGQRWAEAATLLTRLRPLPAPIQTQAARLDGLHRRLGSVLNLPPYPPGVHPPPFGPEKSFAFAVGADRGAQPRVTVFADERGTVAYNFFAYDVKFDGGVRVDMADLNGDGIAELIVAPGPATTPVSLPVRVYDGRDLNLLVEFIPFNNWKGGLFVAGANLQRDGRAILAVNAEGTQHVKVFDLAQGKEIDSFFVHDQKVTGGVRIAWGDVNADGTPDLLTVNGPGNAPTVVKIFNGRNRDVLAEFPVIDNKYRGGAYIAAADLTGHGSAHPVVGLDAGSPPIVRIFDPRGRVLAEWLAYDEKFRGGVRVGVTANQHVVTAPGHGMKNSPLRIFNTARLKDRPIEFVPFSGFDGGLFVGGR